LDLVVLTVSCLPAMDATMRLRAVDPPLGAIFARATIHLVFVLLPCRFICTNQLGIIKKNKIYGKVGKQSIPHKMSK